MIISDLPSLGLALWPRWPATQALYGARAVVMCWWSTPWGVA